MAGRVHYDPRVDYYAVLDLTLTASADQIQHAFRQRAKQLHPDRNDSSEATRQFQQLSEAYAALSDPVLRAEYDQARAMLSFRAAYQSIRRKRAPNVQATNRTISGDGHWRRVFRGLTGSPYRYVFILLALVVLANIAFVVIAGALTADSGTPSIATVTAALTGDGTDSPALPAVLCDSGALISSPRNGTTISAPFEITGAVTTDYQLDWAAVTADGAGTPQNPAWQWLSSGRGAASLDILASPLETAAIAAPQQIYIRLTVGDVTAAQPVQVCQIRVTVARANS